jgi:hypothetical protein
MKTDDETEPLTDDETVIDEGDAEIWNAKKNWIKQEKLKNQNKML